MFNGELDSAEAVKAAEEIIGRKTQAQSLTTDPGMTEEQRVSLRNFLHPSEQPFTEADLQKAVKEAAAVMKVQTPTFTGQDEPATTDEQRIALKEEFFPEWEKRQAVAEAEYIFAATRMRTGKCPTK